MERYGAVAPRAAAAAAAGAADDADTIPLLHGDVSSAAKRPRTSSGGRAWALGVTAACWLGVLGTLQMFAHPTPAPAAILLRSAASKLGGAAAAEAHSAERDRDVISGDRVPREGGGGGGAASAGALSVPLVIGHNAVFQRAPESAAVWGWAPPGAAVTVQVVDPGHQGDGAHLGRDGAKKDADRDEAEEDEDEDEDHRPDRSRNPTESAASSDEPGKTRGAPTSQTHRHEGSHPSDWVLHLGGSTRAMATAVADSTGAWTVRLPPVPASTGLELIISTPGVAPLVRHNVAFGEVWLCSGQSNMQLAMAGAFDADADIADSGNYPLMRFATLKMQAYTVPVNDVPPYITVEPYKDTIWATSSPEAFYPQKSVAAQADPTQPYGGGSPAMGGWFSAVCYTFGRRLYRHFDGTVPIGLVDASWGGKTIEAFAPPSAINADGSVRDASCGTGGTASTATADAGHSDDGAHHSKSNLDLSVGNNDVEVPTGDDKWEKWPDHWRMKGTPTVVANYGAGTVVVDDDDAGPIGVESSEEEAEEAEEADRDPSGWSRSGSKRSSPKSSKSHRKSVRESRLSKAEVEKMTSADYVAKGTETPRRKTLLKLLSSLWESADSETRERFMEKLTEGEIGVVNATVDVAGVPAEMDADDDVSVASPPPPGSPPTPVASPPPPGSDVSAVAVSAVNVSAVADPTAADVSAAVNVSTAVNVSGAVNATAAVETGDSDEEAEVGHRERSNAMAKAVRSSPIKPERAVQQPAKGAAAQKVQQPAKGAAQDPAKTAVQEPAAAQKTGQQQQPAQQQQQQQQPSPAKKQPPDDDMDDISAKLDAIEKMLNDELAERNAFASVPLVNMDDDDDDDAALGLSRRRLLEEIVAEIEASEAVTSAGPVVSGGAAENDPFKAAMSANDAKGSLGGNDPDPYLTQGPSTIWNGMIYPISKFRFAGVAWYQGESNFADPLKYSCLFPATITAWRAGFENPSMSWAFVQLHAYNLHDWSEFRNAQALATRKLPGVVMASAIDLGDPTSPLDPIHPRYKQEVGRRLAQAAIASRYSDYGGVHYSGPRFRDVQPIAVAPEDNHGVKGLVLKFEDGNGGAAPGTTHVSAAAACSLTGSKKCCGESPFAVVDADTGQISRVPFWVDNAGDNGAGKVVLSIPGNVNSIKEVRYAWERFPQCLLYNGVGGYEAYTDAMPAAPWCFDVVTGAPCPVRNLPNPWAAGVRTTADMGFTTMLHKLPVRDLIQWGQKDFAEEYRPASAGGGAGAGEGADAGARVSADVGDAPASDVVDVGDAPASDDVDTSDAPASDDVDTTDAPASDDVDTSDVGSAERLDVDTSDAPASDDVDTSYAPAADDVNASDAPASDDVDTSDADAPASYEDEIIMDTLGTPAYSLFTPGV